MKIFGVRTGSYIVPLYPSDYDEAKKLKEKQVYEMDVKIPRNYEFHKRFMAMINVAHQNSKMDMPFDAYRKFLTMRAGFYETYNTPRGVMVLAKSISFSSMDEVEFKQVYSRVLDKIIEIEGFDREKIIEELENFL